ncbi:right-handed parallel beta-helix repeat-containing protein [Candidatus Sumerlaeota bacterium]|nr:right-handed parallel beta-helix repeat-containing protein [Candidatus Sumerlaeota bacterium]
MSTSIRLLGIGACLAAIMTFTAKSAPAAEDKYPKRDPNQKPVSGATIQATFTVQPGQSIQAAVDRAQPGDRIEVLPGTYKETVSIDLDNISLIGIVANGERPLLQGDNKLNDAVLVSGNNFTISGFEVRNFKGNGVVVSQALNCVFRDLVSDNTGKYAVYPQQCDGVLVENCVASGVWDAAIYAGQCRNVIIRNCEAYYSTIGFETENCINAEMSNNSAHHNSLGMLVVLLPNLPNKESKNNRVVGNRVWENNFPNNSPAGNIVNLVRPGAGIALNAGDNGEITRNRIWNQNSYGIAVYGLQDVLPDTTNIDVEPNPDNNFIHDNEFNKNGEDPAKVDPRFTKPGANGGDIFWSGKGTGNIWKETTSRTFPSPLQGKPASASAGCN